MAPSTRDRGGGECTLFSCISYYIYLAENFSQMDIFLGLNHQLTLYLCVACFEVETVETCPSVTFQSNKYSKRVCLFFALYISHPKSSMFFVVEHIHLSHSATEAILIANQIASTGTVLHSLEHVVCKSKVNIM